MIVSRTEAACGASREEPAARGQHGRGRVSEDERPEEHRPCHTAPHRGGLVPDRHCTRGVGGDERELELVGDEGGGQERVGEGDAGRCRTPPRRRPTTAGRASSRRRARPPRRRASASPTQGPPFRARRQRSTPLPCRPRGRPPRGGGSAPPRARPASAGGSTRPGGSRTGRPRTSRMRPGTTSSRDPSPALEQGFQELQVLRRPLLPDALDPEPREDERYGDERP